MITVIIPIYNSSKYLNKCIRSVLEQTYSDFELLLINDGSTDNSCEICNDWVEKDHRVKYFYKNNSGASSARNYGLNMAQGEWIIFIDSDDFVLPEYLADLYKVVKDNPCIDLCISGLLIYRNGEKSQSICFQNSIYSSKDYSQLFAKLKIHKFGYSVGKLYKMSIIAEHNIRFDDNICIAEDSIFMMNYILKCSQIAFIDKCNYIYRVHANSLSTSVSIYEREFYSYNAYRDVINDMKEQYHMDDKSFLCLYSPIVYFADRVLNSIYADSKTSYKSRLVKLKTVNIYEYKKFKKTNLLIEQMLKYLFVLRLFKVYDLLRINLKLDKVK